MGNIPALCSTGLASSDARAGDKRGEAPYEIAQRLLVDMSSRYAQARRRASRRARTTARSPARPRSRTSLDSHSYSPLDCTACASAARPTPVRTCRRRTGARAGPSPVWKSKLYGAFVLNHRVVLHAIDAAPARWRGDAGSSPLDRARMAASSPRNDLVKNCRVHPTHWLISTQVEA